MDINNLQQSFDKKLNLYNKWQKMSNDNDWDYITYLRMNNGQGLQSIFQDMENALEGGGKGDGIDGNLLSFDRFFADGNKIFMQTADGEVISMDADTGKIKTGEDAMNQVENKFGVGPDAYDIVNFDQGKVQFNEFTFMGTGDGVANVIETQGGAHKYEELDLAKNPGRIEDIINEYKRDHGGKIDSLKDIFGPETQFIAGDNGHAVNYVKDDLMLIQQGNKTFVIDNKKGKLNIEEITAGNIANYLKEEPDSPVQSMKSKVTNDGKIKFEITYKNGDTGSEGSDGITNGSGDPHFYHNGQHVFDLQGAGGGSTGNYTLLKEEGVELTSDFVQAQIGGNGATVMGAQHLKLNTENGLIEVDYQSNGNYTVKLNGEIIDDPSIYGVDVVQNGKKLDITQDDRTFTFNGINAGVNKINAGATGIFTQTKDLVDGKADANNLNQVMIKSPGAVMSAAIKINKGADVNKIAQDFIGTVNTFGVANAAKVMKGASPDLNNKDGVDFNYNPAADNTRTVQEKAELCARIAYAALADGTLDQATKTACVANWIEFSSQAMVADIQSQKGNSYASKYKAGNGYSQSQWNEYMGTVEFATKADINKDGIKDVAMDIDGDGKTDGFDLNNDGILQETERVLAELDEFTTKTEIIDFLG